MPIEIRKKLGENVGHLISVRDNNNNNVIRSDEWRQSILLN